MRKPAMTRRRLLTTATAGGLLLPFTPKLVFSAPAPAVISKAKLDALPHGWYRTNPAAARAFRNGPNFPPNHRKPKGKPSRVSVHSRAIAAKKRAMEEYGNGRITLSEYQTVMQRANRVLSQGSPR